MPRLPQQLQPGAAPVGRRAGAADFGALEAGALAERSGVARELADASQRIFDARESARASRALSEAEVELDQQIEALRDDPDENTHEERFRKAFQDVRARHSGQLSGRWRGEFDERLSVAEARLGARVRDEVRRRRIDGALADTSTALDNWAGAFARADGPERAGILGQGAEHIGRMRAAGVLSESQAQAALDRFRGQATEGLWRRGKNEAPEATLEDLRARRGGFEHMDEAARQAAIESVGAEIEQRRRFDSARESEARVARERAQRDTEESTAKEGLLRATRGKLTVDWIEQNRENLSASVLGQLLGATQREFNPSAIPDPVEYYRLRTLHAQNPAAFAAEKVDPERVGFNKALELIDAQAAARTRDPVTTGQSFSARAIDRFELMEGLEKSERAELLRLAEARLEEYQGEKGAKPGPKEEQAIIDEVILRHVARQPRALGFLPFTGGTSVRSDELPIELPGVDPGLVQEAIEALQLSGSRVTPESIQRLIQAAGEGSQ